MMKHYEQQVMTYQITIGELQLQRAEDSELINDL